MNFYQTVKGISAASRIVDKDGVIIMVSECGSGIPDNSDFEKILSQSISTDGLLKNILTSNTTLQDQWQVQAFLQILQKYKVFLYSSLNERKTKKIRVEPTFQIEKTVHKIQSSLNVERLPVAVMPYGPLTIPMPQFFS